MQGDGKPVIRVRSESLNEPSIYRVSTVYLPCMYRSCSVRAENIDDTEFTMYDLFGDWE